MRADHAWACKGRGVAILKRRVLRGVVWLRRHPGLIAAFGFVSGLLSFLLVERHEGVARLMAVAMLASWVLLMVERALSKAVSARFGFGLSPMLVRYLTQFTHQESLFFALPFFVASTSWNSGQALFTGLLGVMALVTIIDPVYFGRLAKRRWLFLSFHTLTLFALLLVVLPLILQVPAMQTYQLALGVAVALMWSSLEKFAYPDWFYPLVEEKPFLTFGIPRDVFIPMAGDKPAGPPKVILDGFSTTAASRHTFANGLKWGPDGWLYGRVGISSTSWVDVPGVPKGCYAMVTKVHHAAIDGMSGIDLMEAMHTLRADDGPPDTPDTWKPEKVPNSAELLGKSYFNAVTNPLKQLEVAAKAAPGLAKAIKGLVAKDFKVFFKKVEGRQPGSYTLDHSAGLYLYDPQGRLRVYHRYGSGAAALAGDVKKLLAQS